MTEETAKQWSGAVLAALGIVALVLLAMVRKDLPIEAAGYGIVALATRAGGLVQHALSVGAKNGADAAPEKGK